MPDEWMVDWELARRGQVQRQGPVRRRHDVSRRTIGIQVLVIALLVGVGVFWWTTLRLYVTDGYAERWIHKEPPGFAGAVGKPSVVCHHRGLLGLGSVAYCTATYASGVAYRCRVWNPGMAGMGDTMKCNPTPVRHGRHVR